MEHKVVIHQYLKGGKRPIEVDGVLYESRNAMMTAFNLCENDIYQFKKKHPYEEAVSMAIEYRKTQDEKASIRHDNARLKWEAETKKREELKKKREFVYYGRTFKSFKECVEFCEQKFLRRTSFEPVYHLINADSIQAQAKKHNRRLQEQLTLTIKRKYLNLKKIRALNPKYAYCYFNTKEKAVKYLSYKVNECVYLNSSYFYGGKHIIRYIPKQTSK